MRGALLAGALLAACAHLPSPDAVIAESLVWEDVGGAKAYPSWTPAQKEALAAASRSASITPLPLSEEETQDNSDLRISAEDAWRVYLAHAAHSLWLERHHKVPWSLLAMSPEQRALLLDSRTLLRRQEDGSYRFMRTVMGHAVSRDPAAAYRFLGKNGLLRKTPEETVVALTGWANFNLRHAIHGDDLAKRYGWSGPPPVDRLLVPLRPGPRRVWGCWGVTGFYAGVLRGANIPVESSINGSHSRPFFPTANRALHHGDDVYTAQVGPSGNAVPPERILMTMEEFERLTLKPELDCVEGRCNTLDEQAWYNMDRRQWGLAREFMTDYPMSQYAREGPEHLDGSLQGPRIGDKIKLYAKPLFSPEERKAYLAEVETELRRVGGGDLEKGKKLVRERSLAFYR